MALRFIDGFEHYAVPSQLALKYTSVNNVSMGSMTGRRSGAVAVRFNSPNDSLRITLDDQATWIVGFALYTDSHSASTGKLVQLVDSSGAIQITLGIVNGALQLYRGDASTLLATSAQALQAGTWNYVEMKATIADTGGLFEVRVNEQVWATYTGDTKYSSTLATARTVRLSSVPYVNTACHDLYVCDGTGAANNDYLGDCRVDTVRPIGAGAVTGFTPQGGSVNAENVDDATNDGDTTYNVSDVAGTIDTFDCGNIPAITGSIFGAQTNIIARKDDAGSRVLRAIARSSGANYEGADLSLGDSYLAYRQLWPQNPATSAAWTESQINSAEFGYKVQA